MTVPLEITASHSHLYPGARCRAEGCLRDGPVAVTFADGMRVAGHLADGTLSLAAYRTARGTEIAARRWAVAVGEPDDGGTPLRIRAKA
jgi:hypothetical protein